MVEYKETRLFGGEQCDYRFWLWKSTSESYHAANHFTHQLRYLSKLTKCGAWEAESFTCGVGSLIKKCPIGGIE
jgi:hypothetical protein